VNRLVFKWNPYLDFEMSAQEAWLEELSRRGLLFRSRISHLTCFQAGPPAPYRRFRLEVIRDAPLSPLLELYQQAGWHYDGQFCGSLYYLFHTDDPTAPEPYTDPYSKALALEELVHRFRREFWGQFTSILISLFSCFVLFPRAYPILEYPPFLLMLLLLDLTLVPVVLYLRRQSWQGIRRTQQRLEEGDATPLPPAKKLGVLKNVTDLTTTVLFLLCMALAFAELTA